ncbi:hypothetical protein SVAN01_07743 [Stagonosporopsis vannaccii]|nr:hypothetical protein SVAN01_07743 [Stagonosporopsis vannaccii]
MDSSCLWLCCTAAEPGGGRPVPRGLVWGMVSIDKSKGTNDCILGPSSMLLSASNGNIRSPSSYHSCSPGTHPTARRQCTRPPRPAVEANIRVALRTKHKAGGGGGQHSTSAVQEPSPHAASRASSTQTANRNLPHAPSIAAALSSHRRCPHTLSHPYRPLRSPVRAFRTRYLGGATPVCLAFTGRAISTTCQVSPELRMDRDAQYDAHGGRASRRPTLLFHAACTSTRRGRILGGWGPVCERGSAIIIISSRCTTRNS